MAFDRNLIGKSSSWIALIVSLLLFLYSSGTGSSAEKAKLRSDVDKNISDIQHLQEHAATKEEVEQMRDDVKYIRERVDHLADAVDGVDGGKNRHK